MTLLIYKAPSLEEFGGKIPNQRTSVGPTQSHMKLLYSLSEAGRFPIALQNGVQPLQPLHCIRILISSSRLKYESQVLSAISPRKVFIYLSLGPKGAVGHHANPVLSGCKNIRELLTQLPSLLPTLPHTPAELQELAYIFFQGIITIKASAVCTKALISTN